MGAGGLGLAFGAGLVAALNPCGFAMLPAYLALVVRGGGASGPSAVARAVAATAAMAAGFVAVFGAFGLLAVSAANTVQRYLPYATVTIGILLAALGLWQLSGRTARIPMRGPLVTGTRWAPTAALGSMFGYGASYALASLSCTVGPFLAVTGIGVGFTRGALPAVLAYAAGLALIVGTLAMTAALAGSGVVDRLRRIGPYVNRMGGALLVIAGAYVAYYGWFELRLYTAGADPADPVIATAGRVQGVVAGWVHAHGAWPWLVVMVLTVVAWWYWRRTSARVHVRPGD
ncbi:cytochrome c biogenesis CcdA family protein [Mycobacterium sp. URHB0044]|uniref:cytochrome c biogenesis CcdA family protein n=1 Tax=Mycobacterium sp. URHB0044 TaxID=1380386 RepID=UPI00048B3FCD|nr:cytochrome c biogenesis protein CcdA [Mycobacterium sp. URHB0044]